MEKKKEEYVENKLIPSMSQLCDLMAKNNCYYLVGDKVDLLFYNNIIL